MAVVALGRFDVVGHRLLRRDRVLIRDRLEDDVVQRDRGAAHRPVGEAAQHDSVGEPADRPEHELDDGVTRRDRDRFVEGDVEVGGCRQRMLGLERGEDAPHVGEIVRGAVFRRQCRRLALEHGSRDDEIPGGDVTAANQQ